jgi:hypothetical protein
VRFFTPAPLFPTRLTGQRTFPKCRCTYVGQDRKKHLTFSFSSEQKTFMDSGQLPLLRGIHLKKKTASFPFDKDFPKEKTEKKKAIRSSVGLIQQLEDEDRQTIFKLIDKMLTNKKFKDFFQKNVAAL